MADRGYMVFGFNISGTGCKITLKRKLEFLVNQGEYNLPFFSNKKCFGRNHPKCSELSSREDHSAKSYPLSFNQESF